MFKLAKTYSVCLFESLLPRPISVYEKRPLSKFLRHCLIPLSKSLESSGVDLLSGCLHGQEGNLWSWER